MKKKVIMSITMQLGKQISVVHKRMGGKSEKGPYIGLAFLRKNLYITSLKAKSILISILNKFHQSSSY